MLRDQFLDLKDNEYLSDEGLFMYLGNNIQFSEDQTFMIEHKHTTRIGNLYCKVYHVDIYDVNTEEGTESYIVIVEFEYSDDTFYKISFVDQLIQSDWKC